PPLNPGSDDVPRLLPLAAPGPPRVRDVEARHRVGAAVRVLRRRPGAPGRGTGRERPLPDLDAQDPGLGAQALSLVPEQERLDRAPVARAEPLELHAHAGHAA